MKKFLFVSALLALLLLGSLYWAVNSPAVADWLARRYAKPYGFDYGRIEGDLIKGLSIENLRFGGKKLARRIRLRLNPLTLIKAEVTVSKLELLGVDEEVLESMVSAFSTESGSSVSLPFSFNFHRLHLTMNPFEKYGIRVRREELSLDSLCYDGRNFSVGRMHQIAATSIGSIEFEGTYRRRELDLELLSVESLDLPATIAALKSISAALGSENNGSGTASEPNPLLPRRLRARRFLLTLLPFSQGGMKLDWAQIQGHDLDFDLESGRFGGGRATLDWQSNRATLRLSLLFSPHVYRLEEGSVTDLDLDGIERWFTSFSSSDTNTSSASSMPFLPERLEVGELLWELRPQKFRGVELNYAHGRWRDLRIVPAAPVQSSGKFSATLGSDLGALETEGNFSDGTLTLGELQADDLNLSALIERLSLRSPRQPEDGRKRPFTLSRIRIDTARVALRPIKAGSITLEKTVIEGRQIGYDLEDPAKSRGALEAGISGAYLEANLSGRLEGARLVIDRTRPALVRLKEALMRAYGLPIRSEGLSALRLWGALDTRRADLNFVLRGRQLLDPRRVPLPLDLNLSRGKLLYRYRDGALELESRGTMSTPYTPEADLNASVDYEARQGVSYRVDVGADGVRTGVALADALLARTRMQIRGSGSSLVLRARSRGLEARLHSRDLQKATLDLGTRGAIKAAQYLRLPAALKSVYVDARIHAPVDLLRPLPLNGVLTLRSNLLDANGTVALGKASSVSMRLSLPPGSLLKRIEPRFDPSFLEGATLSMGAEANGSALRLEARGVRARLRSTGAKNRIDGSVLLGGSRILLSGNGGKLLASLKTPSVRELLNDLKKIYPIQTPDIDGDLQVRVRLKDLKRLEAKLVSRRLVPDDQARIKSPLEHLDIDLSADLDTGTLRIEDYSFLAAGMKLYATRPSIVTLDSGSLHIDRFWINDALNVTGDYSAKTGRGEFRALARELRLEGEPGAVRLALDLRGTIRNEKLDLSGKVRILGGKLRYDFRTGRYAGDEDIVILQHRRRRTRSYFYRKVRLNLYLDSAAPLQLRQHGVRADLKPQLSLLKEYDAPLQMLGEIVLLPGGYYDFEGKRLEVKKSAVYFTGLPTRPMLDLHLGYRHLGKRIAIDISGSATEPVLNFSSTPRMSRDQILAFLLFDTQSVGESTGDLLNLVGGSLAKSILSNLGLKVDTLVLREKGFRVGKRISSRVSILYDQGEDSRIIVRIEHSPKVETDLSVGRRSQSVDIIYKRSY